MPRTRSEDALVECPICMDPVQFAIETNCGHMFCSACILQVQRGLTGISPLSCPYCRTTVTLLLKFFTETEENLADPDEMLEKQRLDAEISDYNRMHSQVPISMWERLRDAPTILRHVWADMFSWSGVERLYYLRIYSCIFIGLLYMIVPFDLIPEALIGFIGLFDDFVIVGLLLIQITMIYRSRFQGGE